MIKLVEGNVRITRDIEEEMRNKKERSPGNIAQTVSSSLKHSPSHNPFLFPPTAFAIKSSQATVKSKTPCVYGSWLWLHASWVALDEENTQHTKDINYRQSMLSVPLTRIWFRKNRKMKDSQNGRTRCQSKYSYWHS